MSPERPPRRMDPFAEQFWAFTQERDFRLQRCADCGKTRWPPAPVCDGCLSEAFAWAPSPGEGTLVSWVVFHRQYFPEYPPPHPVVLVELDEGPLFIGIPVDIPIQQLQDGMRLRVDWLPGRDRFGEYQLPVFRAVAARPPAT